MALKFVVAAAVAVVTVRLMDSQPQGNVTCPLSCLNTIPHAHYSTKPCHHRFGRCVVGGDGWHCACLPGWTGLLCHVPYKKVQFRPTHTLLLLRWSNASPICSIFIATISCTVTANKQETHQQLEFHESESIVNTQQTSFVKEEEEAMVVKTYFLCQWRSV